MHGSRVVHFILLSPNTMHSEGSLEFDGTYFVVHDHERHGTQGKRMHGLGVNTRETTPKYTT